MKRFHLAAVVPSLFAALALFAPSNAAPVSFAPPPTALPREEIRSICHHYRWSSRRHCTSERTLMFVDRPPLFYPHKYFGGTPHYAQRYPYASYPYYRFHRWYGSPFRYPYYYYY
jgi:hypothetical protein